MMSPPKEKEDPTFVNIRDSVFHGLTHFSEWEQITSDTYHHEKWATLSIHHAVEMYLKARLEKIDPENSVFKKIVRGRVWHPGVRDVIGELEKIPDKISASERKLIEIAIDLTVVRDSLMHDARSGIEDFSIVGWAALAILRSISTHYKVPANDIFDQSPPIEATVFRALKWDQHSTYLQFVEEVLKEEFPNGHPFPACSLCGAEAIVSGRCQSCFAEMEIKECLSCGEEFSAPTFPSRYGIDQISCPVCETSQGSLN